MDRINCGHGEGAGDQNDLWRISIDAMMMHVKRDGTTKPVMFLHKEPYLLSNFKRRTGSSEENNRPDLWGAAVSKFLIKTELTFVTFHRLLFKVLCLSKYGFQDIPNH
jgi:hypothetical protein